MDFFKKNQPIFFILLPFALSLLVALVVVVVQPEGPKAINTQSSDGQAVEPRTTQKPQLKTETVAEGLSNVWDVAQAPDKTLYYSERANKIGAIIDGKPVTIHEAKDAYVKGEGGMLGMTLDPEFASNRYLYACFNTATDVRVARYKVAPDNRSLTDRSDIVTGMPANSSGRHSGCRPRFDANRSLWIGTGDTARSEHPQNPKSLGGKVLRVDREGRGVQGNMGAPFDKRVYSYGHRNVQGLAFYKQSINGVLGYSVEHGPDRDDELNTLSTGNFGWDPGPNYDESVDMTDLKKFPEAVPAVWSSGKSTIAPSGATILEGKQWKSWEGRLMMAVQKDKHVRLFQFDDSAKKVSDEEKILAEFGRVRSVVLGVDGFVYLTTDNGNNQDKIVKVIPQ